MTDYNIEAKIDEWVEKALVLHSDSEGIRFIRPSLSYPRVGRIFGTTHRRATIASYPVLEGVTMWTVTAEDIHEMTHAAVDAINAHKVLLDEHDITGQLDDGTLVSDPVCSHLNGSSSEPRIESLRLVDKSFIHTTVGAK